MQIWDRDVNAAKNMLRVLVAQVTGLPCPASLQRAVLPVADEFMQDALEEVEGAQEAPADEIEDAAAP